MSDKDAEYLRACRERLGMTQIEFATVLGVSRATIKRYESGVDDVPESIRLSLIVVMGLADRILNVYQAKTA